MKASRPAPVPGATRPGERAPGDPPGPTPHRRGDRRCRRGLVAAFVVGFLALQMTVPAVALVQRGAFLLGGSDLTHTDGQQRYYAWQMFSQLAIPATYTITFADGEERVVNGVAVLGRLRGRAYFDPATLAALCDRFDSAVSVRWATLEDTAC